MVNKVDEDDEYNMHLNDFVRPDTPIEASKIKQITKQNQSFNQTMFAIPDEAVERLIEVVSKT